MRRNQREAAEIVTVAGIDDSGAVLRANELEAHDAPTSDDELPGGSTPTPDQDVVEEIGKAIGVTYQEGEPLRAGRKEEERDEHRWELDPASSDDYAGRCAPSEGDSVPVRKMRHEHRSKRPS